MASMGCHTSPFAGVWYPGDPSELADLLARLFDQSASRVPGEPLPGGVGFVVPHAGLEYSGRVAAAVYRTLATYQPRRVILLGFAHRGLPSGVWIPDIESYRTPLGETPLDQPALEGLISAGAARRMNEQALCDNSVELQLPLFANALPDVPVMPLFVSALDAHDRTRVARPLASLVEDGGVVVASSDFTHYGSRYGYQPFKPDRAIAERLHGLDEGFIEAAGSLEPDLFLRDIASSTVCGRQPIALLLETLSCLRGSEDIFQQTLDYETSGDITGDYNNTVGYAALGYFPWRSFQLNERDQKSLLASAHNTLRHYQEHGAGEPQETPDPSAVLDRRGQAFVTLRRDGQLRGCIGRCSSTESLRSVIPKMTLSAALDDRRFSPVGRDETGIEIEISLLSPMKRISDRRRFHVNRDGAYLRSGFFSGLLLPQVAEDRGWTDEQFLDALVRKTGATTDIYDDPETKLYVFRAQIIQ